MRASSPTQTAPRCSSCPCSWPCANAVGLERVVVDSTRPSPAPALRRWRSWEAQIRAHRRPAKPKVAGVYPHPIAFNALPEIDAFLENGYTREEWKGRHERPDKNSAPAGSAVFRGNGGSGSLCSWSHSEGGPCGDKQGHLPGRGPASFCEGARGRSDGRSGGPSLSDRHHGRRQGRGLRRPGPDRSVGRARSGRSWRPSAITSARGCRHERSRASPRCSSRAWLGQGALPPRGVRRGLGKHRDRSRAPAALDRHRGGDCDLHHRCRLASDPDDKPFPGEGTAATEVVFVGEGPGLQRGPAGSTVRMAELGHFSLGKMLSFHLLEAGRGLHHQL